MPPKRRTTTGKSPASRSSSRRTKKPAPSSLKAPKAAPATLGYRMPAEWEPHEATWLAWPHNRESWPDKFEPIPEVWVRMISGLVKGEPVHLLVKDEALYEEAVGLLERAKVPADRVAFHRWPTYDAWARDFGPVFVVREGPDPVGIVDWVYNAWGGKYPPFDLDDAIPKKAAELLNLPCWEPGIVMEGGSLDVNGRGTLLTTEQCLLNKNRNPKLTREKIEGYLKDYLGVRKILWLGEGIAGDDTDGHVDDITRFVAPDTILTAVEEDPKDANHAPLAENLRRLKEMTDAEGKPFRILTMPMPGPVEFKGQRLPASYGNFYIGNEAVLLPVYNHPNDRRAAEVLQSCFPTRRIVKIPSQDLIWGLGACHCVTQQQPAAP